MKTPKGKGDTIGRRKNKKKNIIRDLFNLIFLLASLYVLSISFICFFTLFSFFFGFFFFFCYILSLPGYFAAGLSHSLFLSLFHTRIPLISISLVHSLPFSCVFLFLNFNTLFFSPFHTRIHISRSHFLFFFFFYL